MTTCSPTSVTPHCASSASIRSSCCAADASSPVTASTSRTAARTWPARSRLPSPLECATADGSRPSLDAYYAQSPAIPTASTPGSTAAATARPGDSEAPEAREDPALVTLLVRIADRNGIASARSASGVGLDDVDVEPRKCVHVFPGQDIGTGEIGLDVTDVQWPQSREAYVDARMSTVARPIRPRFWASSLA